MTVQRWTDEMLDELASSVSEMRESMGEMRESISELRSTVGELSSTVSELKSTVGELSSSVSEIKDSVDGLRVTSQALLQVAAQNQRDIELLKQRQIENDQRFNVLLEEVRHLSRRIEEN
ncbi:MAG TPA: hypothetical protein DCL61_06715 [Cyanobacteria bacterium UBA12227]|nr:hypothetical protein [Cyanobacteria bacterium UBA12227]HAX85443.1 hypothetical protein [Cyanobacteria bacterium UBA11370]HBY80125.1 hypothetical protein [Cyanobacteria bacterium UBA11148]